MPPQRPSSSPSSPKTGDLDLGRKIAARRHELGISRKELAVATELSYPYIAQIETGYRLPSMKHQIPIARALGMSLDDLFGPEEELSLPSAAPLQTGPRRSRATTDDVVERCVAEIESLPPAVRLEALSRIQLQIMQGVTDEQARRQR